MVWPCLGARKTMLRKSRPIMYHRVVMVGELDGKKMIKDTRQKLNPGHLRAMVLGACDQVRKVNEDALRPEGREGV